MLLRIMPYLHQPYTGIRVPTLLLFVLLAWTLQLILSAHMYLEVRISMVLLGEDGPPILVYLALTQWGNESRRTNANSFPPKYKLIQ